MTNKIELNTSERILRLEESVKTMQSEGVKQKIIDKYTHELKALEYKYTREQKLLNHINKIKNREKHKKK